MSLQFDVLLVIVRKFEQEKSHKGQLECHLEAYFEDQKKRQAKKAQSIVSDISIEKETTSVKKRKKRTEYTKLYKTKQIQDTAFKANEMGYMQNKIANEIDKKQANMQNKRKDPAFKANEIDKKQAYMPNKGKDPAFKANETDKKQAYMQNKRKRPCF